jgi:hypothetical protein
MNTAVVVAVAVHERLQVKKLIPHRSTPYASAKSISKVPSLHALFKEFSLRVAIDRQLLILPRIVLNLLLHRFHTWRTRINLISSQVTSTKGEFVELKGKKARKTMKRENKITNDELRCPAP